MNPFGNRAISASAGTGKTFALAHRYLALMAAGVAPDRICALTFSRKAAGEIFDTIVERLCLSARDAAERRKTVENMRRQAPALAAPEQPGAYVGLLRRLIDQSHRLRVGTLDSFILGVVRAFPLELGLPPEAKPMDNDGGEAQILRRALLARLCGPDQRDQGAAILKAFRQATFGTESKGLLTRLETTVAQCHVLYRQHAGKAWGDARLIWPDGRWWEGIEASLLAEAADPAYLEKLAGAFGGGGNTAKLGRSCAEIAGTGALHAPDKPWPLKKTVVVTQLLAHAHGGTPAELTYSGGTYTVPPKLWPPLRAALANLVAVEIGRALQTTAGMHALLERYDAVYGDTQRHEGRLTFEDLSCLLAGAGRRPSRQAGAPDRLYIDYRLDGELDHWLLDEFQDTSDSQWGAIANLIDEVVQDEGRSFFYVGDIKQAIYGWRGGNRRLFASVREQCRIATDPARDTLIECHRSLPAVIEAVNRVFEDLPGWAVRCEEGRGPHPDAVGAFMAEWKRHESARRGAGEGFVALLEYEPGTRASGGDSSDGADEQDEAGDPAQYEAIARILQQVQPVRRNLSVAVLVRSNAQGGACLDVLRRRLPDLPAVHEGTGGIVDSPVVTALLALVRYAAHPGDSLALRHVQMSPFADLLEAGGGPAGFPARFLADAQERGFAGALRGLTAGLACPNDDFGRQRLRQLLVAAEEFDATGSRDADGFEDYVRTHQVKSEAAAGTVRVMTVHQSKGLGFDLVLVPFDPGDRSFSNVRAAMLRSDLGTGRRTEDGWMLRPPAQDTLQAAGGPPVAVLDSARADESFAQLCVLYVALTRAKQAMYLLVPKPPASATAVRPADLLRDRLVRRDGAPASLCGLPLLYACGAEDWAEAATAPGTEAPPAERPRLRVGFAPEVRRAEPSKEEAEAHVIPARWLFSGEAGNVRAFGSAIHRLFESVEWLERADIKAVIEAWRKSSTEPAEVVRDVEVQFRACLANSEVRALLGKPSRAAGAEAWREAPFAVVREDGDGKRVLTGRFDRLVVERDGSGRPVRATVVDYKSNRVASEADMRAAAEGYAGQMSDYAAAAAQLLGLDPGAVSACLLFTRTAKVVAVNAAPRGGAPGDVKGEA